MPASMTHSMLMEHPKWIENQTENRPPERVNSSQFKHWAIQSVILTIRAQLALCVSFDIVSAGTCEKKIDSSNPHRVRTWSSLRFLS